MNLGSLKPNATINEEMRNEAFIYEVINAFIHNKTLDYIDFFEMVDYLKDLIVFYCETCNKYHVFEKDFSKIGTFKNGSEFTEYYIKMYL